MNVQCEKMIMAVLSANDSAEVVSDLSEHGFYATILSSTGGFLQKKNVTLMIGVEAASLETALGILEKHAKTRVETTYITPQGTAGMPAMPVKVCNGGIVAFVMNVEKCVKF